MLNNVTKENYKNFLGDLISGDGTVFPSGPMVVPIQEELIIYVK